MIFARKIIFIAIGLELINKFDLLDSGCAVPPHGIARDQTVGESRGCKCVGRGDSMR